MPTAACLSVSLHYVSLGAVHIEWCTKDTPIIGPFVQRTCQSTEDRHNGNKTEVSKQLVTYIVRECQPKLQTD